VTAAVTVISTFAAGRGDDAAALVRVHGRHPGRDRPGGARRNRRAARRAPVRVPRPARRLQPAGGLLLVGNGTQSTGCVGLAPCTDERTAEVKRLYVRPAWRGNGVGYTEGDLPLDGGLVV
jgi:GNAT superfamily N-acetyltransferase